jgi:hypothetical protein
MTEAKGKAWTIDDYKEWIDAAESYLRAITGRSNEKAHLIDEIIVVEGLVNRLKRENLALKRKLIIIAKPECLTSLEKALLDA